MESGTIFLSHASEDKDFVSRVKDKLDRSVVFYDTHTIDAGQKTLDAMKAGVGKACVFVLFHSSYTGKAWVQFEKDLAEVQKIRNRSLRVLVCPLGNESYRTLPDWMQAYMTATQDFGIRDIVRTIVRLSEQAIFEQEPNLRRNYPGREDLERKIVLSVRQAPAKLGQPLSVLVLTGLEGMGKSTLARAIVDRAYPGMRVGGPAFSLPDAADAIDLHLRLSEDIRDGLTPEENADQIRAFMALPPADQAISIGTSLRHWAQINQVVTLRSRWGFRERSRSLPQWLAAFFELLKLDQGLRLILLSERKLPAESLYDFPHVQQFDLEELDGDSIQTVLGELIEPRYQNPARLADVSAEIQGHPATANHVAFLVNSGMSLDSLAVLPDPIHSFQDKTLDKIFRSDALSSFQVQLLELLSWFPRLSIDVVEEVFPDRPPKALVEDLWDLNASSLTVQSEGGYYSVPNVIGGRFRRSSSPSGLELFQRVAALLKKRFDEETITVELIDSLIVGAVAMQGELPSFLKGVVTPSALLQAVEQEYNLGLGGGGEDVARHFAQAYALSRLSLTLKTSDHTLENIMFFGADAAVRTGKQPTDLLDAMQRKGFSTSYYIEGSYLFHVVRDYDAAAKKLSQAVRSGHFRVRTVRLLARIHLRNGKFRLALDALNLVEDARLRRDTGLMTMKIKALHGNRDHKEARELRQALGNRENEYGDLAVLQASRRFRERKYSEALEALESAEMAPKSNKVTLMFLRCAIEIENGDNSNLPQAAGMARAAGREADALQLQARAALVAKDWRTAEGLLNQIDRKDYFDLEVELRMLEMKLGDEALKADPALRLKAETRREEVLRLSASSIEGARF